jgi:rhamnose transport system permease protein
VLLGGVSIFGGRGALHGVIAGVLLIGVIQSAMRLENQTVNVINIVIGALLVLSVMSPSVLAWLSRQPWWRAGLGILRTAPQRGNQR